MPHALGVTGVDDDAESHFNTPSLTSVKAPLYDLGAQAIDLLLAVLAGDSVPDQVNVPASLAVRQSCGCVSPVVVQAAAGPGITCRAPVLMFH